MIKHNALQKLDIDKRDFNLGAVYPQIKIEEVPNTDFVVAMPIKVKDQKETDYCSAYALVAVSEDQEKVELLPEYQFYKTKEISNKPEEWGADLRDACKSATSFGSLPMQGFESKKILTRSEVVDKLFWLNSLDKIASLHKKGSYFKVGGKYDVFDNIRTALWQNRNEKCSVLTGCLWRMSWLDSQNGIIPHIYANDGFGHAFKIFGQKIINNEIYLMAQLSQGDKVGDGGIFYFNRIITNKEIGKYGMFMFKDALPKEVRSYTDASKPLCKNFWLYIISLFK